MRKRYFMDGKRAQQADHAAERETAWAAVRIQTNREELADRIMRVLADDGAARPLEGLYLFRSSVALEPVYGVAKPSFCVIAQGSKEVLLGDSRYRYDPTHYLISTLELPRVSQILEASKERPYLSLLLELTPALVSSVMIDAGQASLSASPEVRAMDVSQLDVDLQDSVVRLIRLLDSTGKPSDQAPVLLPLITREIVYRLLVGNQGARLRHLAVVGGYTPIIARVVQRISEEFDQPLHIENLARELGMSVSGLHHRFKAVTAMSPLQFQKQLRLQEARRLMLSEDYDAASAAFRVGYHDPAYFNREYKSLFGIPPIRHVHSLREEILISAHI